MEITVKIQSNYGANAIYPVCEKAKEFAEIAGSKTLTQRVINAVKRLGYTVKVEQGVAQL